MEILSKLKDDIIKIAIVGELDASGAINLDTIIKKSLEDRHFNIVVDCIRLDYISSAGLGVFISYLAEINEHNGKLVFYNMNEKVKNVFNILGLQNIVTITGDLSEAKKVLHEN